MAEALTQPLGVDPLIAEAKRRARRRRFLVAAAAGLVALGALSLEIGVSGGGGSPGAVPWLPTRPQLGPANPPLAAPCTASQLRATAFFQGAAGNLAGGIQLVNSSSSACALVGRPKLSLGTWRFTRWHQGAASQFDALAPPLGSLRALRPGEHVVARLWIPGYCEMLPASSSRLSPLLLTAPGGGKVGLKGATFPECKVPASVTVQAGRYTPYVPQGLPSSALPLRARILSGTPLVVKGKHIAGPALVATAGGWLSYTVVLTNRSRQAFRFGRTCPAYTEGIGAVQSQAYVLNCHAAGSIAPRRSVRFAMRVRVPAHARLPFPALGWTLAPHTYDAPSAQATIRLH